MREVGWLPWAEATAHDSTDTNVNRQSMSDQASATAPYSFSQSSQNWRDHELETATLSSGSFSLTGLTPTSGETIAASMSQLYSQLAVPDASYYVTAQLAETLADAATSLSGNYSTGGNSYTSTGHLVSNGSLSSAYYNDAASYQRLDVEFDGLLAGSRNEQSVAHTFNLTLSEGVGMAWDVDLTRISGTSTLTAAYS